MRKLLTEQQVLRKFGIGNFYELQPSDFTKLMSMANKVDPEVIKKAIDQFPEFAELMKNVISNQKETVDKAMQLNDESVKACYDTWNRIIGTLEKELENKDLTVEQRERIYDRLMECGRMIDKKDTENKSFLLNVVTGVATVAIVLAAAPIALAMMGKGDNEDSQKEIEQK